MPTWCDGNVVERKTDAWEGNNFHKGYLCQRARARASARPSSKEEARPRKWLGQNGHHAMSPLNDCRLKPLSERDRPLRTTWVTTAANTLPTAAVCEPTLLFVTERGLSVHSKSSAHLAKVSSFRPL